VRRGLSRRLLGVLAAVLVLGAVYVGAVEGIRSIGGLGYVPAASSATTGTHIELSAWPDSMSGCHGRDGGPHSDWVTYCSTTSIRVPAYSTITVTIRQYDTGGALHNTFFDRVYGTVGGIAYLNGKPTTHITPDVVGHTFTIQTPPNGGETQLFVSVPLPGVAANAPNVLTFNGHKYPRPAVVTFRFKTGAPGQYVWHCYVPCGTGLAGDGPSGQAGFGGPMSTIGYMAGTLTVT